MAHTAFGAADAIVSNLGEMLQSMTGNYFVATTHRVVTSAKRYSSAYFYGRELTIPLEALPLDDRYGAAVAASPHHRNTGSMAHRNELLSGRRGTYGQQPWNYSTRSYPELIGRHHPDPEPAA